jgi:hypothetical protein
MYLVKTDVMKLKMLNWRKRLNNIQHKKYQWNANQSTTLRDTIIFVPFNQSKVVIIFKMGKIYDVKARNVANQNQI